MSLGESASALGKVEHTGSAKHGGEHWLHDKVLSAALLLLGTWFIASLILLPGFDQRTILVWLREPTGAVPMALFIIASFRHAYEGMKVVVDDAGRLHAIGKRLSLADVNAESIGLLAFRGAGSQTFRHAIERAIRTSEGTTIWYLRVIHQIAQEAPVWTLDIQGEEWGEVDFPEDVDSAQALTARWDGQRKVKAA